MSQPTREEVEAFIAALNYGMKVSHKPEFLIALAERWLSAARGGRLRLASTELRPGDVVIAKGNWADKTVSGTEIKGEGVKVFYDDGGCTRYHLNFIHDVLRK